jgi:hypothetical protein
LYAGGDSSYNEAYIAGLRKSLNQESEVGLVCSPQKEADVAAYRHLYRRLKHCTSLKEWVLPAATAPALREAFTKVMQEANPSIPVIIGT